MDYKTMKINDIVEWCRDHNQMDWLKKEAAKITYIKSYPRVKVDGKLVLDKTAEPIMKEVPITFIELKKAFVMEFMPEIAPKAEPKKPTFHEIIKNL